MLRIGFDSNKSIMFHLFFLYMNSNHLPLQPHSQVAHHHQKFFILSQYSRLEILNQTYQPWTHLKDSTCLHLKKRRSRPTSTFGKDSGTVETAVNRREWTPQPLLSVPSVIITTVALIRAAAHMKTSNALTMSQDLPEVSVCIACHFLIPSLTAYS